MHNDTYRLAAARVLRRLFDEYAESWVVAGLAGILASASLAKLLSNWQRWSQLHRTEAALVALLGLAVVLQSLALKRFRASVVSGVGLRQVYLGDRIPDVRDYRISEKENFFFLGISAKHLVYDEPFRAKLLALNRNNCRIRFLLLRPDGDYLKRRAQDEHADWGVWQRHVVDSTRELVLLSSGMSGEGIEIRYYDFYPVWRLIAAEGGCMYVSYFLKNRRGKDSPHLLLGNDESDDIHRAFMLHFEEAWHNYSKDARAWLARNPAAAERI